MDPTIITDSKLGMHPLLGRYVNHLYTIQRKYYIFPFTDSYSTDMKHILAPIISLRTNTIHLHHKNVLSTIKPEMGAVVEHYSRHEMLSHSNPTSFVPGGYTGLILYKVIRAMRRGK